MTDSTTETERREAILRELARTGQYPPELTPEQRLVPPDLMEKVRAGYGGRAKHL